MSGIGPPFQLFDHMLASVRPLNLETIVIANHRLAAGAGGRAIILLAGDVPAAGLGMKVESSWLRGRAAHEQELILFQMKQRYAIHDHMPVVAAWDHLLQPMSTGNFAKLLIVQMQKAF